MPREVWEAAGPPIPSGGGLAVARANHPGRFLALVFDVEGRPAAFVKVAMDTLGREPWRRNARPSKDPARRFPHH